MTDSFSRSASLGGHGAAWPTQPPSSTIKKLGEDWATRSALWGTRLGVGEAADRFIASKMMSTREAVNHFENPANRKGLQEVRVVAKTPQLGYSKLFNLGEKGIDWKDLSWKKFRKRVAKNTYSARAKLQQGGLKQFFADTSWKNYWKQTVWGSNIQPVKQLWQGASKINWGSNIAYSVGLGFLGWTVYKSTRQAYVNARQQETGNLKSKLNTYWQTGKALLVESGKSLLSWEAAGIGMAIGKALIPVGGFIPVGGILVGALAATAVYESLNKFLPKPAKT